MLPADLASELAGLALPAWRYCESVGSTNDFALAWGEAGAADGSLVVADEQTAGRGRLDRRWFTPPGAALAFSLVLRPNPAELTCVARFSPLGALAVQQALAVNLNLPAEIKWPNDVLVGRRKVCGILAESTWQGETLTALVLGIGVNITPAAVPPADQLLFPAGCIETALGKPVPRWALLRQILEALLEWRAALCSDRFLAAWQERLAFKGEWVTISSGPATARRGLLLGIDPQGDLRLQEADGSEFNVQAGDLSLRPI
jgi:BirA family biotin operon repressor/biotin-[acetyl-CoA-carboxylase] ligase